MTASGLGLLFMWSKLVHVKVSLSAEGLYELQLALPVTGVSDTAGCRFDKKRRVLTVTIPVA